MGRSVVHFEIIGTDPARLRGYYGELFGWQFDTSGPVSDQVSEPGNYGFVATETASRAASAAARLTRVTWCSTWASRTSRRR